MNDGKPVVDWQGPPDYAERLAVVCDVMDEMKAQDKKWGEQNHPDGTGPAVTMLIAGIKALDAANDARWLCERAAEQGTLTWRHISQEEDFESWAEHPNSEGLYKEIIQAAAVRLAWAQAMKRRWRRAKEADT